MIKKVKWGILSAARCAKAGRAWHAAVRLAEVSAVASRSLEKTAFAREFSIPKLMDRTRIAHDPEIEAI